MDEILNAFDFYAMSDNLLGERVFIPFIDEYGVVVRGDFFIQALYIELEKDGIIVPISISDIIPYKEFNHIDSSLKRLQLIHLINMSLDNNDKVLFEKYSKELIDMK